MQYHFDENRIIKKIDTIKINKDNVNHWNSFSDAPNSDGAIVRCGQLYGTVNEKLDSIKIHL